MSLAHAVLESYPGVDDAVCALSSAVSRYVRGDRAALTEWVFHEVHSATENEIITLVDSACEKLVRDARPDEFADIIGAIDHMKTTVSDALRMEAQPLDYAHESADNIVAMFRVADPALADHLEATGALAARIATEMGLVPERASFVGLCGRVHDIGKMIVPHSLLYKPAALTADEFEVMKRHSTAGEEMLQKMTGLEECAQIVRWHHEAWDGRGYPDRLKGEEIPLEARIVSVADVFHALTSDRCYRPAFTPLEAIDVLVRGSGKLWDPNVIDAAVHILSPRRMVEVA
jgi:HD-GYP domain-containing protein (c-di-GMP phosphodiesterase class II)